MGSLRSLVWVCGASRQGWEREPAWAHRWLLAQLRSDGKGVRGAAYGALYGCAELAGVGAGACMGTPMAARAVTVMASKGVRWAAYGALYECDAELAGVGAGACMGTPMAARAVTVMARVCDGQPTGPCMGVRSWQGGSLHGHFTDGDGDCDCDCDCYCGRFTVLFCVLLYFRAISGDFARFYAILGNFGRFCVDFAIGILATG